MIDRLTAKLEGLERRHDELTDQMAQPDVATDYERVQTLTKERSSLDRLVSLYREYKKTAQELSEARQLIAGGDHELSALAKEEVGTLERQLSQLTDDIHIALLPTDPNDEKSVIVEIRAGAGGDEAALFGADLFRMYSRYATLHSWGVDIIEKNETGIGGIKEIIFEVSGKGAYSRLKHESGVHRVQRVPSTESSGRIHPSTATVAVLPEVAEVEINIKAEELRIDIFHAGGHGGQNVQKVATAVRAVHLPTGITSVCQDERSQLKNKTKAMAVLRARLYDVEQKKQTAAITEERRSQVGTADRSEKIRTYNFPQDRITDHRIEMSLHNLPKVLEGYIDDLIDALVAYDQAKRMEAAVA